MKKFSLLLVSTFGVGLKTWLEKGLYDREISYYRKLEKYLNKFGVLSYDKDYSKPKDENYDYYYNSSNLPKSIFSIFAGFIYCEDIKKYEIIKTNQFSGSWTAALIKFFSRDKILIIRGGHAWDYEGGNILSRKIADLVLKWCFSMADLVFFVSKEDEEKYIKKFGEKMKFKYRIVPNSVDTDIFYYKPRTINDSIKILLVGRLVEMKNFQSVISAVGMMDIEIKRKIIIDIVGDGEFRGRLEKIAKENNVNTNFFGAIPNSEMVNYLHNSDIFILPQVYGSGMSKVLLEAMSTGNIVVASDLPAHRNTVDNRTDGFICQKDEESIKNTIEYIIKNIKSNLMSDIRKNAAEKVKNNFSMLKTAEREYNFLLEIYDKKNV